MSWFNFNDSLNNIKGQISSLASEVLSDGTANDADSSSNIQELQALISRKEAEIQSLRSENELLNEKLHHSSRLVKENEAGNDDGWSWDPPDHTENTAKTISELKKKLEILESEKKDLIVSLEQLDSDCQQATDKLVTIKDELQIEHNKLKTDFEDLKKKNDFLNKINQENQKKITSLEESSPPSSDAASITIQNSHLEEKLQQLKSECENFKNVELKTLKKKFHDLKVVTKKIKHLRDKQNDSIQPEEYTKLERILHEYETKVTSYEQELATLRSINTELQQNIALNQQDIQRLKTSLQEHTEENSNLKENLKIQSIVIEQLKNENITNSKSNNQTIMQLQNELSRIHTENKMLVAEKSKCSTILRDSISKCADVQLPKELGDGSLFAESIVKLILDYKWKCETLDKEVINLTLEKTKILTEKNHEIEKLIRNSEELSNEIIIKTQDLKHYEEECTELIKNNELLITRLDEFKNASNLQTISETNEENMLHLENQLDNSNKRIEELEFVIAEIDNSLLPTSKSELEHVKEQLNVTGTELNFAKKKYEELADSYHKLENDNDSLKSNLEDMKVNFNECYNQKEDLNVAVDQMKSECENTEYKYAEQNINLETLKEEVETHMQTIESLTVENKKLELIRTDIEGKNELMTKEIEDLKQELTATLELLEQKDTSIEELEGILKIARDLENSLRVQIDDLLKNNQILMDLKQSAEANCNRFSADVSNYHSKISELSKNVESLTEQNKLHLSENMVLKEEIRNLKESLVLLQEKSQSSENLQEIIAEKNKLLDEIKLLNDTLLEKNNIVVVLETLQEDYKTLRSNYEHISNDREKIQNDFENFKTSVAENNYPNEDATKNPALEAQIAELTLSRNQLIELIQGKHQENVNYHSEIQRLQQVLSLEAEKSRTFEAQLQNLNATTISAEELAKKDEEIEKLSDQNNFLREKCSKLAENLLQEQSNMQKVITERSETSERELGLQKKLDELRHHLVEVEDYYTKEVRAGELRCEEMQKKLQEIEQREKNSSNRYTSVNIRANQQVETLQTQLQLVTNQRDDLKNKLSDYEDEINKQKAALTNLHSAFQQFQREKDTEIQIETERIGRQVTQEKKVQDGLQKEIGDLRAQLEESKQGLKAAVRLSDQVDASKRQVTTMKDEVTKLQQQLAKSEEKYNKYMNQSDGKVDKMLIKNLIIGLISTNNNLTKDQNQILKIISTVLDFNQQDIEKVKLNKNQQNSWFGSLLHPQVLGGQNITQESLSLAFVKFLEAESKPRELPNLLDSASAMPGEARPGDSSRSSSVRQSPILLNEIVLPTFADFGQNRNSSSILKDVLKDNNNS